MQFHLVQLHIMRYSLRYFPDNVCKCKRGYTGRYCETDNCHNFCVHGSCHRSAKGYPQCHCPRGFGGSRCELNMCGYFCLNGGTCSYNKGDLIPSCECPEHYTGSRCEISRDFKSLCGLYCGESTSRNDYLVSKDRELICRYIIIIIFLVFIY